MKKFVWPLLVIFFLLGGLATILIGQVVLPPEPRTESVVEISDKWAESGHADREAEAFVHWNEDDPAVIPAYCAKCHSAFGYFDYLGEDGSEANVVNADANTGSVVTCAVCHNPSAHAKTDAIFPSKAVMEDLGPNANCAECHQGLNSGKSVTNAVTDLPEDEVNEELAFINVHYKIASGVKFGSDVTVGYEYPGKEYAGFYMHTEDYQLCADCHDPHSLSVTPSDCAVCHPVVSGFDDLRDVRVEGTPDYDGDGDSAEGVYFEMTSLHEQLYATIQTYAAEIVGQPILYSSQFPYWFNDTNGNGTADDGEINFGNQYVTWTPRLVKATYNYHLILEDPGGFAHNPPYLIQLMYDTINNLSETVSVDMTALIRP